MFNNFLVKKNYYLIFVFFSIFFLKTILLNNSFNNYELSLITNSNENLNGQIYIDYGSGFNEQNSIKFFIKKSLVDQEHSFKLNKFQYQIKQIRFDPDNSNKRFLVTIRDIKINDNKIDYSTLKNKDLNFKINKSEIDIIKSSNSNDSNITFEYGHFNIIGFFINKSLSLILIILLILIIIINFNLKKICSFALILLLSSLSVYLISLLIFENKSLFDFISKISIGTNYMTLQSQSLLNFKISLNVIPDPILMTLENPYTEYKNAKADIIHDLSYYKGNYYFYWSIFPAIILAATNILFDYNFIIGDKLFFIITLSFYIASLTYLIQNCLNNKFQTSLLIVLILVSPVITYQIRQLFYPEHGIYQIGYIFPQIFINILLIKIIRDKFFENNDYIIIGILISLIFFGRYSLLFSSICLYLYFLLKLLFRLNKKSFIKKTFYLTAPSIILGILILTLNYIKFESIFNFGQIYQMGSYISRIPDNNLSGFGYYLINFYKYFLYPPYFSLTEFSFYFPDIWKSNFIQFLIQNFVNPKDHGLITSCNEPVFGIFWMFPIIITCTLILTIYNPKNYLKDNLQIISLSFCILIFGNLVLLSVFFSNTRYMIDFFIFIIIPCILVLKKTKYFNYVILISLIFNLFMFNNIIPKYKITKVHENFELNEELFKSINLKKLKCHY